MVTSTYSNIVHTRAPVFKPIAAVNFDAMIKRNGMISDILSKIHSMIDLW